MTAARYAVVAIGNAIVDIIGRCDDDFLARHGAIKGSMRLVDAETMERLYCDMGPGIEISATAPGWYTCPLIKRVSSLGSLGSLPLKAKASPP